MKKAVTFLLIGGLVLAALWLVQQQKTAQAAQLDQLLRARVVELQLSPLTRPNPADPALVVLGEALFFDKELSGNRDSSCATCHHPQFASSDALPLAIGTGGLGIGKERVLGENREFVARNTIDLFNRGVTEWQTMFWDGRISGTPTLGFTSPAGSFLPDGLDSVLAVQAMFPVTIRDEMRGGWYNIAGYTIPPGASPETNEYQTPAGWHDVDVFGNVNELAGIPNEPEHWPEVWQKLMARLLVIPRYQQLFQQAYPTVQLETLGFQHAANALAAYQAQTFTFVNTPWDRYLAGETTALSPEAMAGALLFYGEAGCVVCHSGPLLTDQQYYNIGVPQFGPGKDSFAPLDYGRFHLTNTPTDRYTFRTPPLRNVTLTGPWLHNGAYNSLELVIRHHLNPANALQNYDGSQLPAVLQPTLQNFPVTIHNILATLSPQLPQNLSLSDTQIVQLLAFLQALTDPAAADLEHLIPENVPSGLPVEP